MRNGRAISGKPTAAGATTVTYSVSSGDGQTASQTFTITIEDEDEPEDLVCTAPTPPSGGMVGQSYSVSAPSCTGGTGSYSYSSSSIPSGLALNTNGTITGKPSASGNFSVSITITDSGTPAHVDSVSFTIKIADGPPPDPTPEPPPAKPAVSFGASTYSVQEGLDVTVTVQLSKAASQEVTIPIVKSGTATPGFTGDYIITGYTGAVLVFPAGITSKTITVHSTQDSDLIDETVILTLGALPASVRRGAPDSTTVTIVDFGIPLAPTELRANGHLVNGDFKMRWVPVDAASSYKVQYVKMICHPPGRRGVCTPARQTVAPPGETPSVDWQEVSDSNLSVSTAEIDGEDTIEATISGVPTNSGGGPLYRLEARAVGGMGRSIWSDFIYVNPTSRPFTSSPDEVATIPIYAFQVFGDFQYKICTGGRPPEGGYAAEPLPTGFSVSDIEGAVLTWDDAVRWVLSSGRNIIRTGYTGVGCTAPQIITGIAFNQVMFFDDWAYENTCGGDPREVACWYKHGALLTLTEIGTTIIQLDRHDYRTILMRSEGVDWGEISGAPGNRCTFLHDTVAHEVSHSLGLYHGSAVGDPDPDTPVVSNAALSRAGTPGPHLCSPQLYDVVATMANYQSRITR